MVLNLTACFCFQFDDLRTAADHMPTFVELLISKLEELQGNNSRLEARNSRLEASNNQLWASNSRLEASNSRLEASNGRLEAAEQLIEQLQVNSSRLEAALGERQVSCAQMTEMLQLDDKVQRQGNLFEGLEETVKQLRVKGQEVMGEVQQVKLDCQGNGTGGGERGAAAKQGESSELKIPSSLWIRLEMLK